MPGKITTSPSEWREARLSLLEKEKEHTRQADALAALRADMPLLHVTSDYTFTSTSDSKLTLSDLFAGKSQLLVYHLMFAPEWDGPCKSCSFLIDNLPTHLEWLHSRDTEIVLVSRAPAEKLAEWQEKMGWTAFPWYSSSGSEFNYDFHATQDESVAPVESNYRSKAELEEKSMEYHAGEEPGMSVFIKCPKGGVFHSYSTYGRGLDRVLTTYTLLDLTPLGRQDSDVEGKVLPPGGGKYHFEFE